MSNRLNIENPFYDGNASASAFGWQFQVDAAIFLFLYYIDEVEEIIVEGKYQDIELLCKNNKHIFAQAKSIHNGSSNHRKTKLEDAVISLVKTPADADNGDELLYISNYEAPIKRPDIFKNKVVKLKNAEDEKEEFKKLIENMISKLENIIPTAKASQKPKLNELLNRIKSIDIDNFLIATIYPYINAEQPKDMFVEIENKINELLTVKFEIQSAYLQRFVSRLLTEWHETFLVNATTPTNDRRKQMTKEDLLWQVVAILSEINIEINDLFDNELEPDLVDEYETYYTQRSYYHERFAFFNSLLEALKEYQKNNKGKTKADFIKEHWQDYIEEYTEFSDYSMPAKEYLIKKSLVRLINNRNNIKKNCGRAIKMFIEKLIFEEHPDKSSDTFHKNFNLITSNNENSVGKSTYCRLIFYALGYAVPSTEGANFDRVDTTAHIENDGKKFIIRRSSKSLILEIENDKWSKEYSLPDEHLSFLSYIFGVDSLRIANNLLGLMYIDQEKGWTLLNRGKVIGNNRFSIDELVSALKNIDCEELFKKREIVEHEIDKYQALLNMNSIKEEYYENNNNLQVVTLGEDIKKKIASVQLGIQTIKQSIAEIEKVIKQDKSFFEYIEAMSLYIKTAEGLVKVTKDNIENSCNIEYLKAEKSLLLNQLSRMESERAKLLREYESVIYGTDLFQENITVDTEKKINSALSSINIDIESIKSLLSQAKKEHADIETQIRTTIRTNNEYISEIYKLFFEYARKLNVESFISNKIDYIFTSNLRGKTGAIFQKLIIAYKVAAIKVVEQAINTKLFVVIDSPKAKELDDKNTKQIMDFLHTELSDNQIIVASIFSEKDLFVDFDKIITFKNKAIEPRE